MNDDKRMSLKEFRDEGFLQEANRKFFHPLGLAIGVYWNEDDIQNTQGADVDNEEPIGLVVWDYRSDPEGIIFYTLNDDDAREKAAKVAYLSAEKSATRQGRFGWAIQPIGHEVEGDSVTLP